MYMKMKTSRNTYVKLIVSAVLAAVLMMLLCACGAAEKLEAYEVGGESIPSINSIIGKRSVNGVASGIENGMSYKSYNYKSDTVTEDLMTYVFELMGEHGFIPIVDFNLEDFPGVGQVARESGDDEILIVQFEYESSGYEIKIIKGKGALTFY